VDEEKYSFVNKSNNLVRFFNRNGYSTFFVTSYGEQAFRFVPDLQEWTKVIVEENVEDNKEFACVTTNKIEKACEDFSVLAETIDVLRNNSRAFVFQEMVYGHTSEWTKKTGLKPIEYYNKYFNTFYRELEENNLIDNTLLIINSDHGPRINATDRKHYKVPLMFCARDIEHSNNADFLSHLSFKDILLETISDIKHSGNIKEIFTIGNSGELVYGKISANQKYIFINNRHLAVYTNTTSQEIEQFNKDYKNYLNYFESLKLKK
jgi:membrane-anchored protein YejM (alkaline phosphatase superfamily)